MKAVIFDLGGVVLDSPMEAIAAFERSAGLDDGIVNRTVAAGGSEGAWARLERGELDRDSFALQFSKELGLTAPETVVAMLDTLDRRMGVRQEVVDAIRSLRSAGMPAAALTNNWVPFPPHGLRDEFDVFVESVVEGVRKPEREIYRICLDRLAVRPEACLMLDDIGANLKTAREMGMTTILVRDRSRLLTDLTEALAG